MSGITKGGGGGALGGWVHSKAGQQRRWESLLFQFINEGSYDEQLLPWHHGCENRDTWRQLGPIFVHRWTPEWHTTDETPKPGDEPGDDFE